MKRGSHALYGSDSQESTHCMRTLVQNQGQKAGWPSKGSAFGQWWFLVAFEPPNGKDTGKDADTPEVYLFVYLLPAVRQLHHFLTEFAQVQVVEWILL